MNSVVTHVADEADRQRLVGAGEGGVGTAPVTLRVAVPVIALLAIYLAAALWLGRLPVTDEAYYKAAGCQWAQTGRFAAPEMTNFHLLDGAKVPIEELFATHPPTYPFLFGVVVRVTGFGWPQCLAYDAVIHVLLILAILLWAGRVDRRFYGPLALVVTASLLFWSMPGRPDELAMTFGMIGLYWLMADENRIRNALLGGVACGLVAGTSTGAAVSFAMCTLAVIFTRTASWRTNLGVSLLVGLVASVTFGMVLLPLLLYDIGAIDQFLTIARAIKGYESEYFPLKLAAAWRAGKGLILFQAACYAVAFVGLVLRRNVLSRRDWICLWLAPLGSVVYLFLVFPSKYTYLWFTTPILIVGALLILVRLAGQRRRLAVALGTALAATLAFAAAGSIKGLLVMTGLDKTQSWAFNEEKLREVVPDGSTVLTGDAWMLLRGRCKVYAAYEFSDPDPDSLDYVVLTANGSGKPGVPSIPLEFRDYVETHFRPIYDNLPRQPLTICGKRLTNSAYGFGCYVLARKDPTP